MCFEKMLLKNGDVAFVKWLFILKIFNDGNIEILFIDGFLRY